MHFYDAVSSATQSIFSHKLRSLLTLLGIVIGVMAVVTMFSSVYAIKTVIQTNMEGMGWNYSVIITPGQGYMRGSRRNLAFQRAAQSVQNLNYSDFEALRDEIKPKSIYGMIDQTVQYRVHGKTVPLRLRATNTSFFTNKSYSLLRGRYFSEYENSQAMPVAVLGYFFAREHFGEQDPCGEMISIGNHRYKIVGVLNRDDLNSGAMNFNTWEREEDLKSVYIPLKYGSTYMMPAQSIGYIYIQADSEENFGSMKSRARQMLLSRHNMYPNFSFMDIGDILLKISREIDENMKKWNITLSAIASISLIVGGIGLFSTLLISIQERMMEIGVRKSIGASEGDIFFYFIFEALILALIGALMGILLSWLALKGMQSAIKVELYLPLQGIALGTAFSLLIGFLSGLYPALKASKIDPIKAIYYFE